MNNKLIWEEGKGKEINLWHGATCTMWQTDRKGEGKGNMSLLDFLYIQASCSMPC